MSKAYVKIYINEKCIRVYGGNRSEVVEHVAKLKEADSIKLKEMYPQLRKGDYFRFGVIHKKNRNKVFRFHELIDELLEKDILFLLENNILDKEMVNVELYKSPLELVFDEQGVLATEIDDISDIFNGFIRSNVFDKFSKLDIVIELLRVYKEFIEHNLEHLLKRKGDKQK